MESAVYNQKGDKVGSVKLPENVFGVKWNGDTVHQTVTSLLSSSRKPVAHTKTRGEVRGGGKKPWRQKGTGRARHGSTRSPIWVGGGITHGPRNDKNYFRKVNHKTAVRVLKMILSKKLADKELFLIDDITLTAPKTKEAVAVLKSFSTVPNAGKLSSKNQNAAFIALSGNDKNIKRAFGNINKVLVEDVRNLSVVDALRYKFLILVNPEKSVEVLTKRLA